MLGPPAGHIAHAAPAVPHVDGDSDAHGTHVPVGPPLQQPLGHEFASQTQPCADWLHSRFWPHPLQVAPPVPHDVLVWEAYGSHVPVGPPLQHPPGHEVASQTHPCDDLLHSVPVAHVVQLDPLAPHAWSVSLE